MIKIVQVKVDIEIEVQSESAFAWCKRVEVILPGLN